MRTWRRWPAWDHRRRLQFSLPPVFTFNPASTLTIKGASTASLVSYAAVMPGCVLDEGTIPVYNGKFQFTWDPKAMNQRNLTYDIANRVTGAASIGDVVHLTFFSEETAQDGTKSHSFARVILRGHAGNLDAVKGVKAPVTAAAESAT